MGFREGQKGLKTVNPSDQDGQEQLPEALLAIPQEKGNDKEHFGQDHDYLERTGEIGGSCSLGDNDGHPCKGGGKGRSGFITAYISEDMEPDSEEEDPTRIREERKYSVFFLFLFPEDHRK